MSVTYFFLYIAIALMSFESKLSVSAQTISNVGDIVPAAVSLMETAAQFRELRGGDKKDLVVRVITSQIRRSSHLNPVTRDLLAVTAGNILPPLIDSLVNASKGLHKFKKPTCC